MECCNFAVIDTETNWNDEVMSIGIVAADARSKEKIDSLYYIISTRISGGRDIFGRAWIL